MANEKVKSNGNVKGIVCALFLLGLAMLIPVNYSHFLLSQDGGYGDFKNSVGGNFEYRQIGSRRTENLVREFFEPSSIPFVMALLSLLAASSGGACLAFIVLKRSGEGGGGKGNSGTSTANQKGVYAMSQTQVHQPQTGVAVLFNEGRVAEKFQEFMEQSGWFGRWLKKRSILKEMDTKICLGERYRDTYDTAQRIVTRENEWEVYRQSLDAKKSEQKLRKVAAEAMIKRFERGMSFGENGIAGLEQGLKEELVEKEIIARYKAKMAEQEKRIRDMEGIASRLQMRSEIRNMKESIINDARQDPALRDEEKREKFIDDMEEYFEMLLSEV